MKSDSHLCTLFYVVAHFRKFDTFGVARRDFVTKKWQATHINTNIYIKSLNACFGRLIVSWFQFNRIFCLNFYALCDFFFPFWDMCILRGFDRNLKVH